MHLCHGGAALPIRMAAHVCNSSSDISYRHRRGPNAIHRRHFVFIEATPHRFWCVWGKGDLFAVSVSTILPFLIYDVSSKYRCFLIVAAFWIWEYTYHVTYTHHVTCCIYTSCYIVQCSAELAEDFHWTTFIQYNCNWDPSRPLPFWIGVISVQLPIHGWCPA